MLTFAPSLLHSCGLAWCVGAHSVDAIHLLPPLLLLLLGCRGMQLSAASVAFTTFTLPDLLVKCNGV